MERCSFFECTKNAFGKCTKPDYMCAFKGAKNRIKELEEENQKLKSLCDRMMEKLRVYRSRTNGEYYGGVEYTRLEAEYNKLKGE